MTNEERRQRRQNIAEDAKAGATIKELVSKYKLCLHSINESCREFGVKLVVSGHRPARRTFLILAVLLKDGKKTYQQIADKFSVTRQRVEKIAKDAHEAGIPVRYPRRKGRKNVH